MKGESGMTYLSWARTVAVKASSSERISHGESMMLSWMEVLGLAGYDGCKPVSRLEDGLESSKSKRCEIMWAEGTWEMGSRASLAAQP